MADVLAAPQQAKAQGKADASLRTLAAVSAAHWVSHFHLFVLPMLFPFLKEQLGVGYIELGFALTVLGAVSGLTQAPIGYLADHIGARKVLLMGLTLGGVALIMLGLQLSYTSLIVSAALLGLANSVYHPCDYAILSTHMDEVADGPRVLDPHLRGFPRRRGHAGHRGDTGGDGRRPRRVDRGRRGRPAGAPCCWSPSAFPTPAPPIARSMACHAPKQNIVTPTIILLTVLLHAAWPVQRRHRQFRRGRADERLWRDRSRRPIWR